MTDKEVDELNNDITSAMQIVAKKWFPLAITVIARKFSMKDDSDEHVLIVGNGCEVCSEMRLHNFNKDNNFAHDRCVNEIFQNNDIH